MMPDSDRPTVNTTLERMKEIGVRSMSGCTCTMHDDGTWTIEGHLEECKTLRAEIKKLRAIIRKRPGVQHRD